MTTMSNAGDSEGYHDSKRVIAIVFTTAAIDFVGFSILIPVLPVFANRLGANAFEIALILAIYALAQLLFLPAWGWASDRFGRRPVILISLAGTAASFLLLAYADNLLTIYISRIFSGFFAASIGTCQAIITDVTPPENRVGGMGKIGAAVGLSFIVGPAFGGVLSDFGTQVPFYVVAGIALINLAAAFFWLPETRPIRDERPPLNQLLSSLVPVPIRMLTVVRDRRVGLYLYLWFHIYMAFAALEGSFPLYLIRRFEATTFTIGLLFAWLGLFIVLTQGFLVGRLARYMRESRMVIIGLFVTGLGLLAIVFAPSIYSIYCIGPVVAIGNGLAFPAFTSLYSQTCEARDAGELLGQGNSVGIAGRVLGALGAGLLMDRVGLAAPFWVAGILMLLAGILFTLARSFLVPPNPSRR